MRLRKLLYLLMVEVCVAFCNTSARVVTIDAKAKGTEEYRKNKSSNIQVYSENATSTSIANVTTKDIFVITETVRQTTSTEIAKKATTSTKTVTSQKITNEQNIEKTSEETEDIIQDIENTIQNK